MRKPHRYGSIRTTKGYEDLMNICYLKVTREVEQIDLVPAFVSKQLVDEARRLAKARHPDIPYDRASLETVDEGRAVQVLHVGPYDREQPTIERLHRYVADHGLVIRGRHPEIYISDPRRTKPEKLKTVIRYAVRTVNRLELSRM